MSSNDRWIREHFEELITGFGGAYVAVAKEKVVASGVSLGEVYQHAKAMHPEEIPSILRVPREEELVCRL